MNCKAYIAVVFMAMIVCAHGSWLTNAVNKVNNAIKKAGKAVAGGVKSASQLIPNGKYEAFGIET